MAGLINAPQPAPMAGGAPPGAGPAPGGAPVPPQANAPRGAPANRPQPRQATPEERKQYEAFVDNAYKIIYNKATMQSLIDRIGQGSDFAGNLGQVSSMVCLRVFEGMKQAGQQIDAPMIAQAGLEVTADLADLAKRAGIHEFTGDEVKQAYQRAATVFIHTLASSGMLSAQQLQQLQQVGQQSQGAASSGGFHGHIMNQVNGMNAPQGGAPEPDEGQPAEEAAPDEEQEPPPPRPMMGRR